MFGLLAEQAKYNEIIKPFISLAPVAFCHNMRTPVRYLSIRWAKKIFILIAKRILTPIYPLKVIIRRVPNVIKRVCCNMLFMITGFNHRQLNLSRLDVFVAHYPAGTSAKNIVHYGQILNSKTLKKFDAGGYKNYVKYGQSKPPEYQLERISNQFIALIAAKNDWLASPKDVQLLRSRLRVAPIYDTEVEHPNWNHADFIIGKDSGKYVNTSVLKLLDRFA